MSPNTCLQSARSIQDEW